MSLLGQKRISRAEFEEALVDEIAGFYDDPYGFVMFSLPWGEEGTLLEDHDGPDEWQKEQMMAIAKTLVLDPEANVRDATASGHGIGKRLANSLVLDTFDGPKRWGDVREGTRLIGSDGRPTTVIRSYEDTLRDVYRVTFDDGSSTLADAEHLWNVRGRQERRRGVLSWRTMTTQEILDAGVTRPNGVARARQWEIPTAAPAEFPERKLPLDPFVLGLWLADGTRGQPEFCKPYVELHDYVRSRGFEVRVRSDGKQCHLPGTRRAFEATGVFDKCGYERYVPLEYKYASVEQRRALLEGLLSGDGEAHGSGSVGYASTSRQLVDDVIWLARSLGGKATLQDAIKHGWYPDGSGGRVECRDCYRATLNLDWNPFRVAHKADAYKPSEARYRKRWIVSIEHSHVEEGHCVTVDAPDHLYCANDFIVTHNTAEVAWIILWAMSTRPHLSGVVTANTTAQLQTKTWRELALWHKLLINAHWFKWAATSFKHVDHPETWFVNAVPNTEHNSEAFAGLHAKYKLIIFDEASGIPDKIWEVTEGAMTDPRSLWLVFGNPTRNTGRFVDCFTTDDRWNSRQVDSRECKMTNKEEIAQWVKNYGEDSDFVRVRVRGVFPRAGNLQFIPTDQYDMAVLRELPPEVFMHQPFVVACDVARFGTDQSVIAIRQGRKLHELRKFREYDTMQMAAEVIRAIKQYRPQLTFVDAVGVGAGVVDRLRMLNYDVVEVNAGSKPYDGTVYMNKRVEMADRMKAWLMGADMSCCQNDRECRQAFIGVEYGFADTKTAGGELIRLERKDDMRRRGLPSPDEFDAVAYTFAELLGDANRQSFEPNEDSAFEPEIA